MIFFISLAKCSEEISSSLLNIPLTITPMGCPNSKLGFSNGYVSLQSDGTAQIQKLDDKVYELKVDNQKVAQHSGNRVGLESSSDTKSSYWNFKLSKGGYSIKSNRRKWGIGKQYCLTYKSCGLNEGLTFETCTKSRTNQLFDIKPKEPAAQAEDKDPFENLPKLQKNEDVSDDENEEPSTKQEQPNAETTKEESSDDECDNIPFTEKKVITCKNKNSEPKPINVPAYYYTNGVSPQYSYQPQNYGTTLNPYTYNSMTQAPLSYNQQLNTSSNFNQTPYGATNYGVTQTPSKIYPISHEYYQNLSNQYYNQAYPNTNQYIPSSYYNNFMCKTYPDSARQQQTIYNPECYDKLLKLYLPNYATPQSTCDITSLLEKEKTENKNQPKDLRFVHYK